MYSRDEPFLCSLKCYFGIYFPRCFTTWEINTKITLLWALKRFVTRVHTLFSICSEPNHYLNQVLIYHLHKLNIYICVSREYSRKKKSAFKKSVGKGKFSHPISIMMQKYVCSVSLWVCVCVFRGCRWATKGGVQGCRVTCLIIRIPYHLGSVIMIFILETWGPFEYDDVILPM